MKYLNILVVIILFVFLGCEKEDAKRIEALYNTWEIVDFFSIESRVYAKKDGYNPKIEFKQDGSLGLRLDANGCFGSFKVHSENKIEITAVGCTEICCDSDYSQKIAQMLSKVTSYELDGKSMKLNVPGWGSLHLELHD